MLKRVTLVVALMVFTGFAFNGTVAQSAETQKMGVMNIQKVLLESVAGKKAADILKKRDGELKTQFMAEETVIKALQQEIEKKQTAWSKDKRDEKTREFQLKVRELQSKGKDAQLELRQLQAKELEPIMTMLQTVVKGYGTKHGFTVILDSTASGQSSVLFADPSIDIAKDIASELDKRLK